MPADTNPSGDIFGGWLMCQMDLAAGTVANTVSGGRAATVAVETMTFLKPVRVGDQVSVYASLAKRGTSSMRIAVEAWRRAPGGTVTDRVTEAAFTFVAIDNEGRPRALPGGG
jgi:acyl-CoA thioesterase YciA